MDRSALDDIKLLQQKLREIDDGLEALKKKLTGDVEVAHFDEKDMGVIDIMKDIAKGLK